SINLVSNNYTKNELTGIKEALVSAASNDENPGVRLQALKTLASLPFDDEIKKTYLHVLVNDKVPGNRIEAINSLVKAIESGFKADDEILSVFKNQLEQEENPYIKIRAKTILDSKEL
ncbi:MAG: HEAT repeat domain-containing protein, partial [Ignavibacteriaceae bacterium]|nr:HEAT repeat domain-containing protein [Ignavibacteriaceae bacterium]